jgi:hypothetical protein
MEFTGIIFSRLLRIAWKADGNIVRSHFNGMRSIGTITAVVNALAKAGVDLGDNGSVIPRPKGKAPLIVPRYRKRQKILVNQYGMAEMVGFEPLLLMCRRRQQLPKARGVLQEALHKEALGRRCRAVVAMLPAGHRLSDAPESPWGFP